MVDKEVVEENLGLVRGRMTIDVLDEVMEVMVGLRNEEVVPIIIFAVLPVGIIFIIVLAILRLVVVPEGSLAFVLALTFVNSGFVLAFSIAFSFAFALAGRRIR